MVQLRSRCDAAREGRGYGGEKRLLSWSPWGTWKACCRYSQRDGVPEDQTESSYCAAGPSSRGSSSERLGRLEAAVSVLGMAEGHSCPGVCGGAVQHGAYRA